MTMRASALVTPRACRGGQGGSNKGWAGGTRAASVGRRALSAWDRFPLGQDIHALTRAQNIHVLVDAIPGRQGAAHCDWDGDASKKSDLFKAAPVIGRWSFRTGCGKQRMDALRRRAMDERIPAANSHEKAPGVSTRGFLALPERRVA